MAENLYDNAETPESAASPEGETDTGEKKTAVIDSSICPGMEPGKEFTVKVEKVMEDQYLVSYTPTDEKEMEEPEGEMSQEPPTGPMSGMME